MPLSDEEKQRKQKRREWIKLENVVKTLIPKITNAI